LTDEPTAGSSVAAALALAKSRGFTRDSSVQFGRALDKTHTIGADPAPHLKLEYLDKDGRALKPKEVRDLMHDVSSYYSFAFCVIFILITPFVFSLYVWSIGFP
jgi:hypothetical protein